MTASVARVTTHLRVEDLLMAGVALVAPRVLDALAGQPPTIPSTVDAGPPLLVTLFGIVAILGVLACVATRGPDEPPPLGDGPMTLQGWARFPLAAGVGVTAIETIQRPGFDPEPLVGVTFLLVVVTAIAQPRLPIVPVVVRRALVTPMALLGAGAFNRIIGDDLGSILGGFVGPSAPPQMLAFLPIVIGAIGVMYVMLVVAPRSIADPGASGVAWLVRFVFLLGAVILGGIAA
jgi:hypothetical protein